MNLSTSHHEELEEREAELARLDELLGGGGLMAIEGPPGIGKTSLLDAARRRAEGMAVVSASGSELEREYGFAVARHLFEPVLRQADPDRHAALLDGPARLAAPALGIGAAPAGTGAEALYAVVHGLFWLASNLAAQAPLLIVVDDLQWADAPSQRFLAYLARRLRGMPIALLVAMRPALPDEEREAIEAIAGHAVVLRPAPLSEAAVARLARDRLGEAADAELVGACHRATGGNALLVGELLAELGSRGVDAVEQVSPERLARGVRRRIDALGPAAVALARAVAVVGDGCPRETAAALAGLGDDDAVRAAAGLAAADVLTDAVPLRFRHPIVRAAVVDGIPAAERAAAHGHAARLLAERQAPVAVVAGHLLLTEPAGDDWVIEPLRAAAREARGQGAPELAAGHLRRALAEPPPGALRAEVARELGLAELAAGLAEAEGHLEEALGLIDDAVERAQLGLELANGLALRLRWSDAVAAGRRAMRALDGRDRELELRLDAMVISWARMDRAIRDAGAEDRFLRRAGEVVGTTPAERLVLATAANLLPVDTAAEHARVAYLIEQSVASGAHPSASGATGIASNLIRAGELDEAERYVERQLDVARAGGLLQLYGYLVHMRGWIALERGALADAEADLETAGELARELGIDVRAGAAMLALVLAEQGSAERAEAVLAGPELTGELPVTQVVNVALYFRARANLALGRRDAALADALEVGRRYEQWGIRRAVPAWRSLAAVLLLGSDADEARRLAEEELGLAERWGTPQAIGLARRALGLVGGDVDELRAAVDALGQSPARLEEARARIDLGAALRRAGRRADARGPLEAGMDAAHACGARPLAERARDELRATGARPRRLALSGAQALTASERRVAELAARGLTNRLIAQELFVTTATVETHLRHAFQKLDIGSRRELAAALGEG